MSAVQVNWGLLALYALTVFGFILYISDRLTSLIPLQFVKSRFFPKGFSLDLENIRGVSILKPILGADVNLYANLESFCKLNYPLYELLLCIESKSDPAYVVCTSLIKKYPQVDIQLCIGGENVAPSAKVSNLYRGYKVAKYDLIYISDVNILACPDQLTDLVTQFTDGVGICVQLPYVNEFMFHTFGNILQQLYFGTKHAKWFFYSYSINVLGNGMSCLILKKIIDDNGGLPEMGTYVNEDSLMAFYAFKDGYQMKIGRLTANQNVRSITVGDFQKRIIRWCTVRQHVVPIMCTIPECLIDTLGEAIWGALTFWFLFNLEPTIFVFLHFSYTFMVDYYTLSTISGPGGTKLKMWEFITAWFLQELTSSLLLLRASFNTSIVWGNRIYYLGRRAKILSSRKLTPEDL